MAKFFWDYLYPIESAERLCPLEDALGTQDDFLNKKFSGDECNFIFFAEHEPVYCCPQDKIQPLLTSGKLFRENMGELPAKFFPIPENHGGSVTFHGPGQLTCYLVLCLEEVGLQGPHHLGAVIDAIIKETVAKFGVKGYSLAELAKEAKDETNADLALMSAQGIWVIPPRNKAVKKIASRGLRIVTHPTGDGVKHFTKFGFAINVSTDLDYFKHIYPCGLDIEMTSIRQITGKKPRVLDVARVVADIAVKNLSGLKQS